MDQNYYVDEDINGKQLGKFLSAEDDHKLNIMQKSLGGYFLTHSVYADTLRTC